MRSTVRAMLARASVVLLAARSTGCAVGNSNDGTPRDMASASLGGTPSGGATAVDGALPSGGSAGTSTSYSGGGGNLGVGGGSLVGSGGMTSTGGTGGTASTGGTGIGTGGTPSTGPCGVAPKADGSAPSIDDLNHTGTQIPNNESRRGFWDVWTLNASAQMKPPPGAFDTELNSGTNRLIHWTGTNIGGSADWGPTMTVQLEAGCPYDASIYSGISFTLWGSFTKQSASGSSVGQLKLNFWQPKGVPATASIGGRCSAAACYNNYAIYVTVPTLSGTTVHVSFGALAQSNWAGTIPFAFNAAELLAIQFQPEVNGDSGELASFDLYLDDLTFTR